jgi:hypothetical protein
MHPKLLFLNYLINKYFLNSYHAKHWELHGKQETQHLPHGFYNLSRGKASSQSHK